MELFSTALISFGVRVAAVTPRPASADSANGGDFARIDPSTLKVYIFPDAEMLAEEMPGGNSPYSPFDRWSSRISHVLSAIFRGSKETNRIQLPWD
jgi:hypothetical protein